MTRVEGGVTHASRRVLVVARLIVVIALAGCQATSATPTLAPSSVSPTAEPTATSASLAPPPPPTAAPTPNPFTSPTLVTIGATETVFTWSRDRCEALDIPDLSARAFRDAQGNVQLIAAHYINRRFVGASLNTVKHQCAVVMRSAGSRDPSLFSNDQWIAAPYTEDGTTIYALVHDEFYGSKAFGSCSGVPTTGPCWYNAITLATSTDGGASYHPAATPPANLVASAPQQYVANGGPYGFFNPSNIIKGKDGYYYAFILEKFLHAVPNTTVAECVMRTQDLSDASSWRAWNGDAFFKPDVSFTVPFIDPYLEPDKAKAAVACGGIPADNLGYLNGGVTYNTYLNRYVMVGITALADAGGEHWGVYYSFSDDLVNWTPRQLLFEEPLPWTYKPGGAHFYLYASLLDPDSTSRNFDTSGRTAYLYMTRNNPLSGNYLDRDLIRVPVEFFPTSAEAASAQVAFKP